MNTQNNTPASEVMFESLEPRLLLSGTAEQQVVQLLDATPALFVENQGQWADSSIRYAIQSSQANVLFSDNGLIFQLFQEEAVEGSEEDTITHVTEFSAVFDGGNTVSPVGISQTGTAYNYFVGDETTWRTGVASYEMLAYMELYSGVDLYVSGASDGIKYEFHVAPGADYGQIQISYEGTNGLILDADGALHVQTSLGELIDQPPQIYQEIDGVRSDVAGGFALVDTDTCTFAISGYVDETAELVVDPELHVTTFGGSARDLGSGIATDGTGGAFVVGTTYSADFPGPSGGFHGGDHDAFVARVRSDGELDWATFLGGSDKDWGMHIGVDSQGYVMMVGATISEDYAEAVNSYHRGTRPDIQDCIVARITPDGIPEWSRYLGSKAHDRGYAIDLDSHGNAIVAGRTEAHGGFDGMRNEFRGGDNDAFLAKVNSDSSLEWAIYVGGGHKDAATGIDVDEFGRIFLTGGTHSDDFEWRHRTNTFQDGDHDAFVARIDPHIPDDFPVDWVRWATFVGGTGNDNGNKVYAEDDTRIMMSGTTTSPGIAGATNQYLGGANDAFVAALNPAGIQVWATHIGGNGRDEAHALAVDYCGNALVTGETDSDDLIAAENSLHGVEIDAYVTIVDTSGVPTWSIYIGGSSADNGNGISLDDSGVAWITGATKSDDLEGASDIELGDEDVFVARIVLNHAPVANGDAYNVDEDGVLTVPAFGGFENPLDFATRSRPRCVVSEDFNADGRMDLAVTNYGGSSVSVLYSLPGGGFTEHEVCLTRSSPWGIVSADFNRDNRMDLATPNHGAGKVSILYGQETGGFSDPRIEDVEEGPRNIVTADFNKDGLPDLATPNYGADNVSVLCRFRPRACR